MPEHPTNTHHAPQIVRGVRRWFLLRHRWFRHLKRWQRWVVRLAIGVPMLLLAVMLVLTRSPLTRSLVLPHLERVTNLSISADRVYVRANGRLVMDSVEFRIPSLPGPAGLLLRADRLTADVDWEDAIVGSAPVREVTLDRPVFRVSQAVADGELNLAFVDPPSAAARVPGRPMELPRLLAKDGMIELGEHTPARFTLLKALPVEGMLSAAPKGERGYQVGLTEFRRERGSLRRGFQIHGRIDDDSLAIEMDDFSLDEWPPHTFPRPVRQLFADLGLRGRVPKATFRFSEEQGMSAELTLDGVELNLPIRPTDAPGGQFMRMHGVKGSVTFGQDAVLVRADGSLEDLPYSVVLHYEGTSPDSPFMCEIISRDFHVEKFPRLLPYAPPLVAERLADFSGPTATLDTRLVLRRGRADDGTPSDIAFQGWMTVSNGRAALDKFPYPFQDLSARVYFDNDKVEVRDVRGVSPTGATLTARADISPTNDDAQIDVWVSVQNAPVDEVLEKAFGPGRDRLMHALFNREKHRKLLDAGLVISPEGAQARRAEIETIRNDVAEGRMDAAAAARRVATLEAELAAPVFEFGGLADVEVRVHRPPGDTVEWTTDIDVHLKRAGLVPQAFPIPVHARDVFCQIRDEDARISGGSYSALRGGTATVAGSFVLPPRRRPDADPRPEVTIDLAAMPLDETVIQALPGADDAPLKRALRGLGLSGSAEGRVRIAPLDVLGRAEPGADGTGFDAVLWIADAASAPADGGGAHPTLITDAAGVLRVTERNLALELDARTAGEYGGGTVRVETDAEFQFRRNPAEETAPPTIRTTVRAPDADLRLPVERVVRVFSEKAGGEVAALRERHKPEGVMDVVAAISIGGGATRSVRLGLSGAEGVAFDWLGGRVATPAASGGVTVECIGGVAAVFDAVRGPLTFDGVRTGEVQLDGWYRFAKPREGAPRAEPALDEGGRVLHVSGTEGRFESPFVPAVLEKPLGKDRLALLRSIHPRGEFTAEVDIRGGGGDPLRIAGTIEPRTFACEIEGVAAEFHDCSGWLSFAGGTGAFENLTGRARDWSVTLDGSWKAADGGLLLDMELDAAGGALGPDARAFLPEGLKKALADIKLVVGGPFTLSNARLALYTGVDRSRAWSRFDGAIGFEDVALEAGAKVSRCDGRLNAHFERSGAGAPTYRIGAYADRLTIGTADAQNARAVIQSGLSPGEVLIPLITGDCHGGRFAGRARVAPVGDTEKEYSSSFQLSGVDFGLLLHDLAAEAAASAGQEGSTPPEPRPAPDADSKGRLDAEFAVAGFIGVPETRRGRGAGRVFGKDVRLINLPGIVPLIEVSNLALPSNEALDYAEVDFYVDGGVIFFDRLSVFSRSIEIAGFGTMTWPHMDLDLRFNSRSARPIPVVSLLVQGIRNQLVATSVRGTAKKPDVRLVSMPGTRRMLGRVIGTEETERSRRLLELERRSSLSRHGIRPASRGIPHTASVPDAPSLGQ